MCVVVVVCHDVCVYTPVCVPSLAISCVSHEGDNGAEWVPCCLPHRWAEMWAQRCQELTAACPAYMNFLRSFLNCSSQGRLLRWPRPRRGAGGAGQRSLSHH